LFELEKEFFLLFEKLKLIVNVILNNGIKKSQISDVTFDVDEKLGTYTFGIGAKISVETKKVLTHKEKRRKQLIIFFLLSLVFMLGLATGGLWLPSSEASVGRILILLSEIPAFLFSLVMTRMFLGKGSRRK
jgi:predicted Na+-dependent transporter